eukprot:scaffold3.g6332.t1
MAPVLLVVDFPYTGPFGADMAAAMKDLAESIAREPGFIWKVWTESQERQEAGGVYLFSDRQSAQQYITMHEARLKSFGIPQVNAKLFEINEPLSAIDCAKLAAS